MRYPGPLVSFSARSDIAFLAGFIDGNAHGSIDKLRKLRNGAAHSQSASACSSTATRCARFATWVRARRQPSTGWRASCSCGPW